MDVFRVVGIDWSSLILPHGCISRGHTGIMLLNSLAPVLLLVIVFSLYAFRALLSLPSGSRASPRAIGGAMIKGLLGGMPLALVVSFAFVPSVSAHVFSSWSCEGYGDVDAITVDATTNIAVPSSSARLTYYLKRDLSVVCYQSAEHTEVVAVAIVMMILWPIGVQILYLTLLYSVRRPLHNRTPTPLTRATAFLHRDYKVEYFYWEAVDLARRIILTGWVALVNERDAFFRIVIGLLTSLAVMVLTLVVDPYKHEEDQAMAVSAQVRSE